MGRRTRDRDAVQRPRRGDQPGVGVRRCPGRRGPRRPGCRAAALARGGEGLGAAGAVVGHPVGGAQRLEVGAGGVPKTRSTSARPARGTVLEGGEDAATVVVDDDDRQVRTRLARTDRQPVGCRGGRSGRRASAYAGRLGSGERHADRRRHQSRRCRRAPVGDDLDAAAGPSAPDARPEGEVEVADRVGRADDEDGLGGGARPSTCASPSPVGRRTPRLPRRRERLAGRGPGGRPPGATAATIVGPPALGARSASVPAGSASAGPRATAGGPPRPRRRARRRGGPWRPHATDPATERRGDDLDAAARAGGGAPTTGRARVGRPTTTTRSGTWASTQSVAASSSGPWGGRGPHAERPERLGHEGVAAASRPVARQERRGPRSRCRRGRRPSARRPSMASSSAAGGGRRTGRGRPPPRAPPPSRPSRGSGQPAALEVRSERVTEGDVEVDRPGRPTQPGAAPWPRPGPGRPCCATTRSGRHARSAAGRSADQATAAPKIPGWSVVWLAPVPRSSAGRSAVTGRRAGPAVVGLEHGGVEVRDGGA